MKELVLKSQIHTSRKLKVCSNCKTKIRVSDIYARVRTDSYPKNDKILCSKCFAFDENSGGQKA